MSQHGRIDEHTPLRPLINTHIGAATVVGKSYRRSIDSQISHFTDASVSHVTSTLTTYLGSTFNRLIADVYD